MPRVRYTLHLASFAGTKGCVQKMARADASDSESRQHTPVPDAQATILSSYYPLTPNTTAPLPIALVTPLPLVPEIAFGVFAEEWVAQRAAALPPRFARKLATGSPRWTPSAVRRDKDGDIIMDADSVSPPWIARKLSAHRAALCMAVTPTGSEGPLELEYHSNAGSPAIVVDGAIEDDTTATAPVTSPAASVLDVGPCIKRARVTVVAPSDRVLRSRKGTPRPIPRRLEKQDGTEGQRAARMKAVRFSTPVGGKGQMYAGEVARKCTVFAEERHGFRIICASPV
ncbi:hypothetical protein HYPSUDRAFT_1083942 [Hypholoma sublateritium FD-334 SS-4]|uniref:Uncharacterized protein n=1 Tax=Hypholoma sublateritium (strain FD-334 SS-4) TaxID=945553 RepID=A0A0D2NUT0_HYPSF|nr:hypothetical protein HYPSUDRAFT_1083942 [Hypholoma sublateritium FD-334 SS-4]